MALYALDLTFFRKRSNEWTEQKEEMLRKHPRVVLHQQAILANLCDTAAANEQAGDQLEDCASLDTSPGLFPFPYFSDQEDGEGGEGGGRPLPSIKFLDEAEEKAMDARCWGESSVRDPGMEAGKWNLHLDPMSAVRQTDAHGFGPMPWASKGGSYGTPVHGQRCEEVGSRAGQQQASAMYQGVCPVSSRGKQRPYFRGGRPVQEPLIRHSQPKPWMSRRRPAYVP